MAIWSHKKLRSIKNDIQEQDRIGGVGKLHIPYALDGWRRSTCNKCKSIFYCEKMERSTYKERHRTVKLCPDCDPFPNDWKRKGTKEDDRVYLLRCEAHGIKITRPTN